MGLAFARAGGASAQIGAAESGRMSCWRCLAVTFVKCGADSDARCGIKFDFYSLSGCGSAWPRCGAGKRLAIILHTIRPFVAILKHFRHPSGVGRHLLFLGTGSLFLVDRKGKPKHNISVSVRFVEFGPRVGRLSTGLLHGAAVYFDKKWSVGHL
jgi:hypothetical protein